MGWTVAALVMGLFVGLFAGLMYAPEGGVPLVPALIGGAVFGLILGLVAREHWRRQGL